MSVAGKNDSALTVRNVTVKFGGHLALDDVALDAAPGQVTGLIGPNGAGKTTMFNVVTGLLVPQRGEVRLGGVDLTQLSPYRRARHGLARTFQRLELFGLLTVRENVQLAETLGGRRGRRGAARADELLERVGLDDVADVRADEMPTGKARLVELARALATRPRVLLLDEPASGLDEGETEALGELLAAIAQDGVAVVLVEHDVQLVMRACHDVHVLDFGSIIARGTPDQVQRDQAVLDAYLGAGTGSVTS
ncbi:MAG TPA: ABC transporter ATP-binding protein [Acidimicrobiales bacterium]|nr:ABC transporter ATP-binding protein [Acidimicrobiales bacterium]